jgi:two-component system, cell cycle response regulator DivK
VRAEEFKHRAQHIGFAKPAPQQIRRQPGQRQQPLRPVVLAKHPAERGEREGLRIGGGGWRVLQNCQPRLQGIERSASKMGCAARMAKRILVVEDNDLNRKLFCDVLVSQGYAVEPVADGRDVLEKARGYVPNLIIMDIQLPNVSGLDLIEAVKADSLMRSIPVLAVTAYAGKGDEERIRDAGADNYLAKPVSIGPFMAAVRSLVDSTG